MASKRIPQQELQQQQQQQRQLQRERGTPKDVSLLRAKRLIILVVLLSAALATLLFVYCASSRTTSATMLNNNSLLKLSFISSLGSLSTLAGIIFGDSLTHALAFGVAVREDITMLLALSFVRCVRGVFHQC